MLKFQINDIFWTFQGEGKNAGTRALFIRLPFCNLSCSWCDTTFNTFEEVQAHELLEIFNQEESNFVVITGGEPSMNKHTPKIAKLLHTVGAQIAMESNGCFPIPDGIDYLTVSPKEESNFKIHPHALQQANELKYVVDQNFDFEILERHKNRIQGLYLSPEYTNMKENLESIFEYIKENPQWKISLQTHKWMNIK